MTKTYSELRQAALFQASRDIRRVAAQVLDDCSNDVELASEQTLRWTLNQARRNSWLANDLERQGHEETIASGHVEAALRRSHDLYTRAIDAFEKRVEARGAISLETLHSFD